MTKERRMTKMGKIKQNRTKRDKRRRIKASETESARWLDELRADKEFGGARLAESGRLAFLAAKLYFGDEFIRALKQGRINHYPPLFLYLARLGRKLDSGDITDLLPTRSLKRADRTQSQPSAPRNPARK